MIRNSLIIFLLLISTTVSSGVVVKDYEAQINDLIKSKYSNLQLTIVLSEIYTEISNNIGAMATDSKTYEPDKIYYASILYYTLAPFEGARLNYSCDEYKGYLMYGYRSEWEDLPPPIHDAWKIIKRVCK